MVYIDAMRKVTIAILILLGSALGSVFVLSAAIAQGHINPANSGPIVIDCKQRWHIFYSPHNRFDTFLVDTDTGRCWISAATKTGGTVWMEIPKDSLP